jgi:hypothetical protein
MAENRSGISANAFMGRPQDETATVRALTSNQAALDSVNVQLVRISTQMTEFSNSLTRISGLMAESSALERLKEQQQANQERVLAEQKLREGKESVVERKIQNALSQPVQKVGAKAQGTLGNLMRFFTSLLSGWLLLQGIQALKAYSEGNKKRLQDIGKNTIKTLGIIGATFGAIKLGLGVATSSLIRAGSYISQAVFSGLFRRPVQALISAVKGVKIPGISPKPKVKPSSRTPQARSTNILSASPGGRITGALTGAFNMFSGKGPGESAAGATTAGLGAAALSRIPLGPLNPVKGLLAFATIPLFNEAGMKGYNLTKQYVTQNNKLDLDIISKAGGIKNIFTTEPNTAKTADIVARPAAQVSSQSRATDTSSIGPEPEGKTQVVITDATTNQQPQVVPTATGSAAELPYISSSNPDNFYILYSQVHYNVVI